MNRNEYMSILEKKLSNLPKEEFKAAIAYFQEYFDEAGPDKEQEAIEKLGPPNAVSAKILAEFAVKASDDDPKSPKKGMSAIWLAILCIFAAPMAIPLGFAAIGLLIGFFGVLFSIVVSAGAVILTFIVTAVACFVASIAAFFVSPVNGVLLLGVSMLLGGLALICIMPTYYIIRAFVSWIAKMILKLFRGNRGVSSS